MIVIIDSSTLVSASILWTFESKHGQYRLTAKFNDESMALFDFLKLHREIKCIITKTVESESKNVLRRSVENVVDGHITKGKLSHYLSNKFDLMNLQDILANASMDRMENIIEEYSSRLPISLSERDSIKEKEIIPFFDELIPKTQPYFPAPYVPNSIKGSKSGLEDILNVMVDSQPNGIIYKGYPETKDLIIMSEAVQIYRTHCKDGDIVYVASLDNHFKPNPVFVGKPSCKLRKSIGMKRVDSTVRDMLNKHFGFKGEHPIQILEDFKNHANTQPSKV